MFTNSHNILTGDTNTSKQNTLAQQWLCKALDTAHVANGIKNAAIELLSMKSFTNNLASLTLGDRHIFYEDECKL